MTGVCSPFSSIAQPLHHLPHPFDGKGRLTQRACRDAEELSRVIVRRRPVGAERPAAAATVNDRPLPSPADPDGDGVHQPATVALPVPRLYVHMEAHKAIGKWCKGPAPGLW